MCKYYLIGTQSCYNRLPPAIPKRPSSFRHNSNSNVPNETYKFNRLRHNTLNRGTQSSALSQFPGGISTVEKRGTTERRSSYQNDGKSRSMTNLRRQSSICQPFNTGTLERSNIKRPEVNIASSLSLRNSSTVSRKKSNESLSLKRPPPPLPPSNKLNSCGNKVRSISHSFSSPAKSDHLPRCPSSSTDAVASFNQSSVGCLKGKGTSNQLSRVHKNNLQHYDKATTFKNIGIPSSGILD